MRSGIAVSGSLCLALGMGGCGSDNVFGDFGTIYGAESSAERAAAVVPPTVVPMASVGRIELGRTRDGFVLTALGTAPGLGYAQPRLRARRDGALGRDGFVDFDLVANEPDAGFQLPQGTPRARAIRADALIRLERLERAAGVRVHALRNAQEIAF